MSWNDHITGFLVDEDRRLSSKAALVLFIILGVLFVDNYLGFSYNYNTDRKIEQVLKINSLIKDSACDSTTRIFALNIRSEIIDRKNSVDYLLSLFRGRSNISIKHQANIPIDSAKKNDPNISSIKNNFWFNISAGGIFYFLAIIMIPVMLLTDKTTSFSQRLATGIASTISFIVCGLFFIWLLGFIPQITTSTWIWNYLINFIIQATTIGTLIYLVQKKK